MKSLFFLLLFSALYSSAKTLVDRTCSKNVLNEMKTIDPKPKSPRFECLEGDYDANGSMDYVVYYAYEENKIGQSNYWVLFFDKEKLKTSMKLENKEDAPQNVKSADLSKLECPEIKFEGTGFISPAEGGRPYHLYFWDSSNKKLEYKPLKCGCWECEASTEDVCQDLIKKAVLDWGKNKKIIQLEILDAKLEETAKGLFSVPTSGFFENEFLSINLEVQVEPEKDSQTCKVSSIKEIERHPHP